MKTNIVIFAGELYEIIGEAIAETLDENGQEIMLPVVLIAKVETSGHPSFIASFWTPLTTLKTMISNIDYQYSEWSLGIELGYRRAKKNHED